MLLVVYLAFLLRVIQLDSQSLWRDEVDAIRFSGWSLRTLVIGLFQEGHNGPLFFLLLRPWRYLTGNSEFALRYPSAMMGAVAIPLGYVLARQLGLSRRAGILVSLLLATSPYLVWYGQEAKMYTLLLALVTLAFVAYLKALAGGRLGWWAVFVLATSLSFYTHILAPLMLVVYGVVALLHVNYLRRRWQAWLISMACLTLPYLPLVIWQFPLLIEGADRGHPFYPLRQEIFLLLHLYSSGLFRFVGLTAIVLVVFLLLCALFLANRRAAAESLTARKRSLLAAWVLLPIITVYLISLRVPVFEDRYLIYIMPPFYLLIVLGIILLREHTRRLAGLCLGLILMINLMGIWFQQREPVKANFRAAAAQLESQPQPPSTIMIQMPYLRHTFDYYYPHEYTLIEGLWTNDGKTEETVHAEMARLTDELSELWLVVSEEELWDNRQMVRAWLNQNAHLVEKTHFTRVDLYHYRLRPGTIEAPSSNTALQ